MEDDINKIINTLYLFVPNLIPSAETQLMFNEATQNNCKISFDEKYTERRVISDMIVQHDIGSAQQVNAPIYLICAHQIKEGIDGANKNKNNVMFNHPNLREYYVEIVSIQYPRDSLLMSYEESDFNEQYKNSKLFFKEYIGESLLNIFITYPDMETKYLIGILKLRHQLDHVTPKNFNFFRKR